MYLPLLALSALLLASEASLAAAKSIFEAPTRVQRRHASFDQLLRREAWQALNPQLERRNPAPASASSSSSTTAPNAATNFNTPKWNATTVAACTKALNTIKESTNDAGMLACYNIAFLNTTSGVFQADLRLYQVSAMSGAFTGIQSNQISLALTYPDATASEAGASQKRSILAVRDDATSTVTSSVDSVMNELQQFQFIGQVDKTLSLSKVSATKQMALLIPTIQISAPSAANAKSTVSTNLTAADTVYFVNGEFGGQTAAGAAAANPTTEAAVKASAGAFVVPGVSFGIFPVGFIVTMVWTGLFSVAVGYGTWGRMRFRDNYRNRVKRANTGLGPTI